MTHNNETDEPCPAVLRCPDRTFCPLPCQEAGSREDPDHRPPGYVTKTDAPACECWWTDPSTWLSAASCGYGSGYEPGSQMEWNPDCPAHPAEEQPR